MYCDVRSYRGADNDTDHFLLTSKFKIKLQGHNNAERRRKKFSVNLEALKEIEIQGNYATNVGNQLRKLEGQDVNSEWTQAIKLIKEVAE